MTDIIYDIGLSGNFWHTVRDFLTGGVSRVIQVNTDTWSKANDADKRQMVRQSLKKGAEDVIYGESTSVEESLRTLHAEVEGDETWKIWFRRNNWIKAMFNRAESEASLAKRLIEDGNRDGYASVEARITKAVFEYVDPYLIRSLIQPDLDQGLDNKQTQIQSQASFSNGIMEWAMANTPLAIGLGVATISSIIIIANLSTKENSKNLPPNKIGVQGLQ